jgi:hypothetical protein
MTELGRVNCTYRLTRVLVGFAAITCMELRDLLPAEACGRAADRHREKQSV